MIPHWKQKFALLWTGQALSILSSMISQYALIWYLTDLTGSPAVLSLATMAALVPQGILSLFTGTFADRFDRRWIMIISDGAIAGVPDAGGRRLCRSSSGGPYPGGGRAAQCGRRISCPLHPGCHAPVGPPRCPDPVRRLEPGIQTVSMLLSPALAAVLYARIPLAWILLLDTLGAAFAIAGVQLARCPPCGRSTGPAAPALAGHPRGAHCAAFSRWLWELSLICACSPWPSCRCPPCFP